MTRSRREGSDKRRYIVSGSVLSERLIGGENMTEEEKYLIIENAINEKLIIRATYNGHVRVMCPHVLGTKENSSQALFYQFAGHSSSGLKPDGDRSNWRCMFLSELSDLSSEIGEWHTAPNHGRPNTCVDGLTSKSSGKVEAARRHDPRPLTPGAAGCFHRGAGLNGRCSDRPGKAGVARGGRPAWPSLLSESGEESWRFGGDTEADDGIRWRVDRALEPVVLGTDGEGR